MRLQRNYYEILGLPRTSSPLEIKRKYHELARQFHPDRAQDKELAQRLFVQINQAYQILIDPQRRTEYDSSLLAGTATPRANKPKPPQPSAASPEQVAKWMREASDAYLRGDRDLVLKFCQRVLRADHKNAEAYQLMGDLYADRGQRQEALTAYRTASGLQPANLMLQNKIQRLEVLIARPPAPVESAEPKPVKAKERSPRANGQKAPKNSFFGRLIGKAKPG